MFRIIRKYFKNTLHSLHFTPRALNAKDLVIPASTVDSHQDLSNVLDLIWLKTAPRLRKRLPSALNVTALTQLTTNNV